MCLHNIHIHLQQMVLKITSTLQVWSCTLAHSVSVYSKVAQFHIVAGCFIMHQEDSLHMGTGILEVLGYI